MLRFEGNGESVALEFVEKTAELLYPSKVSAIELAR